MEVLGDSLGFFWDGFLRNGGFLAWVSEGTL